jgi:hypothetical protein
MGEEVRLAFEIFVPEGRLRIAQRFNAGDHVPGGRSPEGAADTPLRLHTRVDFSRPFGTWAATLAFPTLKRWAIISHPSGMFV